MYNRRRVNQYYTRSKFAQKEQEIKRVNRIYGKRGGNKL